MAKNTQTPSSLKDVTLIKIYSIVSQGTDEDFQALKATTDSLAWFFRLLSENIVIEKTRTIKLEYLNDDLMIEYQDYESKLPYIRPLLNYISFNRIQSLAKITPSIWSSLDHDQKNALLLAALFTNAEAIDENKINNTNFDLYFKARNFSDNLLKILSLGANLIDTVASDGRPWFDVLIENTYNSNQVAEEAHEMFSTQDQVKEMLKALEEKRIPILSSNPEIIKKYSEKLKDFSNRISALRSGSIFSYERRFNKMQSLKECLDYIEALKDQISYLSEFDLLIQNACISNDTSLKQVKEKLELLAKPANIHSYKPEIIAQFHQKVIEGHNESLLLKEIKELFDRVLINNKPIAVVSEASINSITVPSNNSYGSKQSLDNPR